MHLKYVLNAECLSGSRNKVSFFLPLHERANEYAIAWVEFNGVVHVLKNNFDLVVDFRRSIILTTIHANSIFPTLSVIYL